MKQNTKRITRRAFTIYAVANATAYVIFHLAYLFSSGTLGAILEYVSYYFTKSVNFIATPLLATVTLRVYAERGMKRTLPMLVAVSSARCFYTLPCFYMTLVDGYGYNSLIAVAISLAASVLMIVATACGVIISVAAAVAVLKFTGKNTKSKVIDELPSIIRRPSDLAFLERYNLPVLVFAILRFTVNILTELIDTVTFFVAYGSDYTFTEISTMLINYVLMFVLLIISYLACIRAKNAMISAVPQDKSDMIEA